MKATDPKDDNAIDQHSDAPHNWQSATITGQYDNRYAGHLSVRWLKLDSMLRFQTDRYMITGDINRRKANINVEVTGNVTGSYVLNSPDSMRQDGVWHDWLTEKNFSIGSSTAITVKVAFIFDMDGPDDRKTVTQTFTL